MLLNGRQLVGWRSRAKCEQCREPGLTLLPQEDLDYRGSGLRPVYRERDDRAIVVEIYLCPVHWELWRLWAEKRRWR